MQSGEPGSKYTEYQINCKVQRNLSAYVPRPTRLQPIQINCKALLTYCLGKKEN